MKKIQKFPKPENVSVIDESELSELIANEDNDYKFLVIDVRPFIEFSKNHIKNSINFNLPSTLLKRTNFSLEKSINNLSQFDNNKLVEFLNKNNNAGSIIFYDDSKIVNNEINLSLFGLVNKFLLNCSNNWNFNKLFILNNGFDSFRNSYPNLLESFSNEQMHKNQNQLKLNSAKTLYMPNNSKNMENTTTTTTTTTIEAPNYLSMHKRSVSLQTFNNKYNNPASSLRSPISPNLSRFQLPSLPKTPIFKIRQNEEILIDEDEDENEDEQKDNEKELKIMNNQRNFESNLFFGFIYLEKLTNNLKFDLSFLPEWYKLLLSNSKSNLSFTKKFKQLEFNEKKRLNSMISNNSIGYGIELGYKNRYKDIFPYEHSRVKLPLTPLEEEEQAEERQKQDCQMQQEGYINANHINSSINEDFNYIATQAPLLSTMNDFIRLCFNENIKIIINLTSQFENGIEKCYPYWDDENFIKILDSFDFNSCIKIRRLLIKKYNFELLQIQVLNWEDFGIINLENYINIYKLIFMKKYLTENLTDFSRTKNFNTLVHCSAGCGRTGTFCTIDSILNNQNEINEKFTEFHENNNTTTYNTNNNNKSINKNYDPIFEIVENFRNQRISMVQTFRQFLLIYDCTINFFKLKFKITDFFDDFKQIGILNDFLSNERQHTKSGGK